MKHTTNSEILQQTINPDPDDNHDYEGPAYSFGDCGAAMISNAYFFATILVLLVPYSVG